MNLPENYLVCGSLSSFLLIEPSVLWWRDWLNHWLALFEHLSFMSNALYKDLMYFFTSSCWGCKQGYSFQSLVSLALQTGIWTFKQVLYSNSLQKVSRLTGVTRSRLTKFLIMNYKMHYFCAYNFFRTVNELPRKFIAKLHSMVWEDSTRDENLKGPFSRHF